MSGGSKKSSTLKELFKGIIMIKMISFWKKILPDPEFDCWLFISLFTSIYNTGTALGGGHYLRQVFIENWPHDKWHLVVSAVKNSDISEVIECWNTLSSLLVSAVKIQTFREFLDAGRTLFSLWVSTIRIQTFREFSSAGKTLSSLWVSTIKIQTFQRILDLASHHTIQLYFVGIWTFISVTYYLAAVTGIGNASHTLLHYHLSLTCIVQETGAWSKSHKLPI